MQPRDYAYLYELEENFWWFVGMRQITKALLDSVCDAAEQRQVLDAGCGTGGMLSCLSRYSDGRDVVGIDLSQTALDFCRQRNHKKLARASVSELPFADSTFDLVTCFDALQHVPDKDNRRAINEFYRVLRPGGLLFLRVAAYQWLRSGHDEAIAVQRRYTLTDLSARLGGAGFTIHRATYANTLLLPVAAIKRLIFSRLVSAEPESEVKPWSRTWAWLNGLLLLPLKAESSLLTKINLPFGVSAICIARKPDA